MAPRLVNQSPGRQVRKVGIKNSCRGRSCTRGWGRAEGLPGAQTEFADRDLFILDEYTRRFGAVEHGSSRKFLSHLLFQVPLCWKFGQHESASILQEV